MKREKMSLENRAKQFLPYAAVKGLEEAIAAENQKYQERVEPKSKTPEKEDFPELELPINNSV